MRGLLLLLSCLMLFACAKKERSVLRLQGNTMGTSWHITLVDHQVIDKDRVANIIKEQLLEVNQQFSTYIPESEISRFNAYKHTRAFSVSEEVVEVVKLAQMISEKTQGAFDGSVAPLVNLWGFGKTFSFKQPSDQAIAQVMSHVGYQHLKTKNNPPQLVKDIPQLQIDLSAIAKGYAVDKLAELLDKQGVKNYLVEIGGEIKVKGVNTKGERWHIAIEKPMIGKMRNQQIAQQVIHLENTAVATSGDYRNYFEENGRRYSHTIDPKTGRPVTHNLASVTVLHPSATLADGFATAIMVLGEEKGLALAKQEGLPVYMIMYSSKDEAGFSVVSTLKVHPVNP